MSCVVSPLNEIKYPKRSEYAACGTTCLHNQILATFYVLSQIRVVWAYIHVHPRSLARRCSLAWHTQIVEALAVLKHHPHLHPTRHPPDGALWHRK